MNAEQLNRHREILAGAASDVAMLTREHEGRQNLWMPSELCNGVQSLELPLEYAAVLALNLLTEEGLPHFSILLATHLGAEGPWRQWANIWTAEEDRHGTVLRTCLTCIEAVDMVAFERLQYAYVRNGFMPDWAHDPYRLIAYTVLQERATQISYKHISEQVRPHNRVIERVAAKIALDEARHAGMYRMMFELVFLKDPLDALDALEDVMRNFAMPGTTIPGFDDFAHLQTSLNIFGAKHYAEIVEQTIRWVEKISGRLATPEGISLRIERLWRFHKVVVRRAGRDTSIPSRSVRFSFLPGWSTAV